MDPERIAFAPADSAEHDRGIREPVMRSPRPPAEAEPCDCIVCAAQATRPFASVGGRDYRRCDRCKAVFLEPAQRLPLDREREQYRLHRNEPSDPDYRRFLSRLADPLMRRLEPHREGLDYGCGPGPALVAMLREAGHRMSLFDPLFFPDPAPLHGTYDFITCTETIEHFHHPIVEFARFDRMLRPGGRLALMTRFRTDDEPFDSWTYRRDPTHVVFYREETLHHLARERGWSCETPVRDVALMRKPAPALREEVK